MDFMAMLTVVLGLLVLLFLAASGKSEAAPVILMIICVSVPLWGIALHFGLIELKPTQNDNERNEIEMGVVTPSRNLNESRKNLKKALDILRREQSKESEVPVEYRMSLYSDSGESAWRFVEELDSSNGNKILSGLILNTQEGTYNNLDVYITRRGDFGEYDYSIELLTMGGYSARFPVSKSDIDSTINKIKDGIKMYNEKQVNTYKEVFDTVMVDNNESAKELIDTIVTLI